MSKTDKNVLASGDKYTYFVTSPYHDLFDIIKLHMCSWAYEDSSECLEIGVQIKLKKEWRDRLGGGGGHTVSLPIVFWLPWIKKGDESKVEDLYHQMSKKENAAFIFNDACPTTTDCTAGKSDEGQILTFCHRDKLTVLPVDINALDNGCLRVTVKVPSSYQVTNDIYVRFCVALPPTAFCIHREAFSKEVRVYNINFGQIRNQPKELEVSELCGVKDVFALHILPNSYLQTFTDPHAFNHIRILEAWKYCHFAKGSKFLRDNIKQDEMIVSFSKHSYSEAKVGRECPFYSVFERDCMGKKQIWGSVWINVICSLLVAAITAVSGIFCGKLISGNNAKPPLDSKGGQTVSLSESESRQ